MVGSQTGLARYSVRGASEHTFVPGYTEDEARGAVATSLCYSEALRKLGLRPAGGNHRVLRHWVDEIWRIPTDHFDPVQARFAGLRRNRPIPLEAVLVEGSGYSRATLKRRLFATGLKPRHCELCGQDEDWHGVPMSLILDHINGVPDDNRLENLRIVCPNCAATFDTHCGRKNRLAQRECLRCGAAFVPRYAKQDYCSRQCGMRHDRGRRDPKPQTRKVERPPYAQLMSDLQSTSFVAIGRTYGVSDNAVRKWIRWY
jgi:Zn ribbon nucleic-acid-binding protein